jgi:hypothetical protein
VVVRIGVSASEIETENQVKKAGNGGAWAYAAACIVLLYIVMTRRAHSLPMATSEAGSAQASQTSYPLAGAILDGRG